MIYLFILLFFTVFIEFNVAITTRGARNSWRDTYPELPHYQQPRDQYRDYSQTSFYNRRPISLSNEDIYREAERYNSNFNPRFHRQNRWSFFNNGQKVLNTEAFFMNNPTDFHSNKHENLNTVITENSHTVNANRGTRQTLYKPEPHLPWEDALRHSVYLTLIRDKIDNIIAINRIHPVHNSEKNQNPKDIYDSTDIDLWRNIKKASFKTNGKERGPVFGDIAILSRGKLIENSEGFEFIEDENFMECIECHLYSSRPNEYEAEKILMANCDHPNCKNQAIRALWTVRRIRHRNSDDNEQKFMYELMFSIASPRSGNTKLDYNLPSETFTINENEKEIKNGIDDKKNKVVFVDEKSNKHNLNEKHFDGRNVNKHFDNKLTNEDTTLNTGEYSNIPKSDPRIMSEHGEHNENYRSKSHLPVITHLHHHYYLNDMGIPMLKPSIKYDKESNFETYVPNVEINTEINPRVITKTTVAENNPIATPEAEYYTTNYPIESTSHVIRSKSSSVVPLFNKSKKKSHLTVKQFVPSPKDDRIVYSELDPLYTSTTPIPVVHFDEPKIKESYPIRHPKHYNINNDDKKLENIDATPIPIQDYEDSITNPDVGTTIEHIYIPESTTKLEEKEYKPYETTRTEPIHIVYPETSTHSNPNTELPKDNSNSKRLDRKPYKITRRIKQKTFSELLKSTPPKLSTQVYSITNKPSKDIESQSFNTTELQQKISDVSRKFASNKTSNFEPQRTSRRKYQRKYNLWNLKRNKPALISTTETTTMVDESILNTEKYSMDEYNTESMFETTNSDAYNDNIEGESEKDISIDRVSTKSDSDDEPLSESTNLHEDFTDSGEMTTEIVDTVVTDDFTDEFETTNYPDDDAVEMQHSTKATKSDGQDEEEVMYTPLTRKSYVTSISLKLGNKTRPFYHSAMQITPDTNSTLTDIDDENITEKVTVTPEFHVMNKTTTGFLKSEKEIKTQSVVGTSTTEKVGTTEDDVVVAKIVQHTSLHKLKIEDEK